MTLILVLLMFAIFIGIDYLRSPQAVKEMTVAPTKDAIPSNARFMPVHLASPAQARGIAGK